MAFDDYQSSVIPGTVSYGLSPGSMTNGNKTQLEDGEFFFIVHSDGLFTLHGTGARYRERDWQNRKQWTLVPVSVSDQ